MALSSKEKLDIIKGSLNGEVDKPAFLAIQEAEALMAEEDAIQQQSAPTQEQPIEQPEVASTGGSAPAGPSVPHPSTGSSQPHLVNSASSMEIGFDQASGTSRGATSLGTQGTYKKGGPKIDPPPFEVSMCSNGEWNGESVKTGCGYRDSAHNLYGSGAMTIGGLSDKSMSGSVRAGLGYSTHVPYSPMTGHVGLSGGTRFNMSENDTKFQPIFDATASVGIEGEFGGNSYNWREPWKYGAGVYGKNDLVGGTGTTAGVYGNVGLFSGKVGYNAKTGPEATIGFGLPIRQDGGVYHAGGLYHNINHKKKSGTSNSKKNSTISNKAYNNMKSGFKKQDGGFNYEAPTLQKSMSMDELLRRQRFQESSFRHKIVNKDSGATGVAQIMPNTLDYAKMKGWVPKSTTMKDLKTYDVSEKIQVNYMNNLLERDWNKGSDKVKRAKALIAYNWGPDNTRKQLNKLKKEGVDIYSDDLSWLSYFNEESRGYVDRILLNKGNFEEQYNQGLKDNIPLKMRMGGCSKSKMLYNKTMRKK